MKNRRENVKDNTDWFRNFNSRLIEFLGEKDIGGEKRNKVLTK